jgi:hypothetical protein
MDISAFIEKIIGSEIRLGTRDPALLRPGDRLTGRVMDVENGIRARIDFGSFRARADVRFPVVTGDVIHVRVVDTGNPLHLHLEATIADGTQGARGDTAGVEPVSPRQLRDLGNLIFGFRSNAGEKLSGSMGNALTRLADQAMPLNLESGVSELAGSLQSRIEHSGLFFEKRLEAVLLKIGSEMHTLPLRALAGHPEILRVLDSDTRSNLMVASNYFSEKAADSDKPMNSATIDLKTALGLLINQMTGQLNRAMARVAASGPMTYGAAQKETVPWEALRLSHFPASLLAFLGEMEKSDIRFDEKMQPVLSDLLRNGKALFPEMGSGKHANPSSLLNDVKIGLLTIRSFLWEKAAEHERLDRPMIKEMRVLFQGLKSEMDTMGNIASGRETAVDKLVKSIVGFSTYFRNSGFSSNKELGGSVAALVHAAKNLPRHFSGNKAGFERLLSRKVTPAMVALTEFFDAREAELKSVTVKDLMSFRHMAERFIADMNRDPTGGGGDRRQPDTPQMFTYTLPLDPDKSAARLKVYYPNKRTKNSDGNDFRISLLLSMDKLGDVRTDFFFVLKNLNITFYVNKPEVKRLLEQELGDIRLSLGKTFRSLTLKVVFSETKVSNFHMETPVVDNRRMLDVKV